MTMPCFVTQRADAREVAVGRDEDAVGADDRLEHDRRDGVRALDHEHVREVLERALAFLGGVVAWKAERYR
jgi:hypothetical protein